ncbi:hypothetical protein LguiA_012467 [Lonicera macranthoides]
MAPIAATGYLTTPTVIYTNPRAKFSFSAYASISTRHRSTTTTVRSSSSFQNPKPLQSTSINPLKTLLSLSAASSSGIMFALASLLGHGSGHGGRHNGFWSRIFCPVAMASTNDSQEYDHHGLPVGITFQLSKLSGFKKYKLSEVFFMDQKQRHNNIRMDDLFFDMSVRAGGVYTKAELQKELETLSTCGMFDKVNFEGKSKADGTIGLTISFVESTWSGAERFRCINVGLLPQPKPIEMELEGMTQREINEYAVRQEREYWKRIEKSRPCLVPPSLLKEISYMLRRERKVSARLLQRIADRVHRWYHDQGFAHAHVVNFGNLNSMSKELICEVVEGDITRLAIQFEDKLGNICEGSTKLEVVRREVPKQLRQGNVFNIEAAKQALQNINSLALFSNIEVDPRLDEKNEGGVVVEIKLKELKQKSVDVSTEWSIVPGRGGRPTLASIQPGGTVSFEHRNLKGLNRSIHGSITASNFLDPQDDLTFELEYVHPYLDGVNNPRNRTLRTSCFNSRKHSPVFTGGPGLDEVPLIIVDRAGIKANITENFTRQSKFTYGLVMEEITTRAEGGHISPNGGRVLPDGDIASDGPSTTLSGSGIDQMAFVQANITRDNTKFVNGAIVGERNVFQLDQGLGIGSKFPFFNRHQLTLTKFIQLKQVEEGACKPPPPVLVLHGRYGGCVGDLPSYDAFTLGGPYSVRGYNMGEIGAARNILEVAAELRVPVKNTHVYAFVEHGNDLGSSKDVKGNSTEVYGRIGQGSSYGVGVKLGSVRAEYAVDHNSGTGAVFFRFGERF